MTLRCTHDPRRRGSQPTLDERDGRDPELGRRPQLIASGDSGAGPGSHSPSPRTGVPSPEVAAAGRW